MNRSFSERPAQLGSLLAEVVRRRGIAEQSATRELNATWSRVAGNRIGQHSFVRKLRGGVLEIAVSNGTVLEELSSYLRHDLLAAIRKEESCRDVQALKFVRVN